MNGFEVSVICCTYNQDQYIVECLESLVNQQTDFKYEILVHDDASNDTTAEIIRFYEKKYPGVVKGIIQKENQFSKDTHILERIILPIAQGDFLAFCEGDDFWCDSRKLQKQYDIMQIHPDCTMCAHRTQRISASGTRLKSLIEPNLFQPGVINGEKFVRAFLNGSESGGFQTSSFFIRREMLTERDDFYKKFYVGDDPVLLWCGYKGNIFYMRDVMSTYRVASDGSTNNMLKNKEYAIMRAKTNLEGFLAFNMATSGIYWEDLKKRVMYYKAQTVFAEKGKCTKKEMQEFCRELTPREIFLSKIKFTWIGNLLRNIKGVVQKRK